MDGEDNQDIEMSSEEIRNLLAERDNLMAERDNERRRADSETQRADAAESQRDTAHGQLATATVAGLSAQEQSAQREIEVATSEIEQIKGQKTALLEEGKFREASDLDEKIADAAARRHAAQQRKGYLAGQREQASATPTHPVDRFIAANPQYTEAEKQWIRQNPRYATDRNFHERVNAAHTEAMNSNMERFSPEYFKKLTDAGYMRTPAPAADPAPRRQQRQQQQPGDVVIDEGQGDDPYSSAATGGDVDADTTPAARPAPRQPQRPAMNAAPPSRRSPTAGGNGNSNGQQMRLTQEQAEAALAMSEYFPEDVQNGGDAAIYAYYAKLNTSPMARRKREEWQQGA